MTWTPGQNEAIDAMANAGLDLQAPMLAMQAAFCIGYGENDWTQDTCSYDAQNGNHYCGVFQLGPGWQREHSYQDTAWWAKYAFQRGFYSYGGLIEIASNHPGQSMGWVANCCQGAYADLGVGADYYNRYSAQAIELLHERLPAYVPGSSKISPAPYNSAAGPGIPAVSAYDPSPLIRAGAKSMSKHGRRAWEHANFIRDYVAGCDHVNLGGPVARD